MQAPQTPPDPPPEDSYVEQVQRKASRMVRARKEKRSVWVAFAQVGTIGWQFVLPLVAGTLGGAALGRLTGWQWPRLAGLLLGLALGLWGASRAIRAGLEDP